MPLFAKIMILQFENTNFWLTFVLRCKNLMSYETSRRYTGLAQMLCNNFLEYES